MKKFFLAILAVGAVATAQAQKAGSILLYGNVGYNSFKTTSSDATPGTVDEIVKTNSWNISPGVGYQLNRNWTVGLNFSYGSGRTDFDPSTGMYLGGTMVTVDEAKTREFMVGPFVRMTTPLNRTFFLFSQLNASYWSGKDQYEVIGAADHENDFKGFNVNLFPAVGVNFTKCLALNFSFGGIGYAQRTWDMNNSAGSANFLLPGETKESEFDFTFGRQFNIGISANLGGRRHRGGHSEPGMEHRHMDTSDDSEEDMPKRSRNTDVDE